MIQALTRNWIWKLAALAIAIALWIAVAREPELVTSLSAPLEFKNMPTDLDFGSTVPDRIHLEIRGLSGRFSRENLSDVGVVLDLADARAGERTYTIRSNNVNLPSGVSFERAIPSQITLNFEHLVFREVRIEPLYVKTPEGYRISSEVIHPPRVRIRGPEDRVKMIERVRTDPVDLSGVVSQREFQTHANVGDSQVRVESPTAIKLIVTLERSGIRNAQ